MPDGLRESYNDVESLLNDVVESTSRFDYWEKLDEKYCLEGDRAGYGTGLTRRLLELGYVPASCSGSQMIIAPIRLSLL